MAWQRFRVLQLQWQSGSLENWLEDSKKVKHNLVPQAASKLQDVKVWSKNFKIWNLVTLVPLKVQGCVLPFWKPPINISKDPDCHGCCSTLNISQAMLKFVSLLVSYYMRLKTNAPGLYVLSFSYKNFKIWHLVTLVPLEIQGCVLPFWKPLINISKEPYCHGCCSALHQPRHAENCILLSKVL